MGRLLFFVLLVIAVYLIVRSLFPKARNHPDQIEAQLLRRCRVCGTFVPKSTAVEANGAVYCSATHRDADAR